MPGRYIGTVGYYQLRNPVQPDLRFFDTHLRSRDTFFLLFSSTCCAHAILLCAYHVMVHPWYKKNEKKYKSQIDYVSIFGLAGR